MQYNFSSRPVSSFPLSPPTHLPPPRLHGRKYLVVNETDKFQRRPIPLDGLATPFHGQGNANLAPLKVEPSRCSPRIKAGTSKLCSGSQGADSLFFFSFLSFFFFPPPVTRSSRLTFSSSYLSFIGRLGLANRDRACSFDRSDDGDRTIFMGV